MHVTTNDSHWFAASNVVVHFHADFAPHLAPKKADEMMAVAILMAGMQEVQHREYWMQGVPDAEQSPDVRTVYREERPNGASPLLHQQDVEVVSYTEHSSSESLADFVARTKFATDTSYDDLTTILVHVKAKTRLPSSNDWASALAPTGKKTPVIVLGRVATDKPIYRFAVVHPAVQGAVDYDPYKLLKTQGYTGTFKWMRGTKDRSTYDATEKHCPFEKFRIDCKLLRSQ